MEGGEAHRNLFSDTYPITFSISNDGTSAVTDRVRVNVREEGIFGEETKQVVTDPITLAPGEARTLTVEVPGLISGPFSPATTATIRFKGFKMAAVKYDRP